MEVLTEKGCERNKNQYIKRHFDYWEVDIKEQSVMKRQRIQNEIANEY